MLFKERRQGRKEKRRRRKIFKQLLYELKRKRNNWNLKKEALERTLRRT
jgi:hypothetical protein